MSAAKDAMGAEAMHGPRTQAEPAQAASPMLAVSPQAVLSSQALFAGQREVLILHHGEAYRLRITRQDKLILTK
jgi:hemin uptake protein HemP